MAISTQGVGGGGVVLRISIYRDYQGIFAGELKFSISGSLGGSDSFASILFFFNRDFNVCIKPPGNVYGLEISACNLFEIKFWPGHFLGF